MVWEHVEICGVQITGKCIREAKSESRHFHACPRLKKNSPPDSSHHPLRQTEINYPPRHKGSAYRKSI